MEEDNENGNSAMKVHTDVPGGNAHFLQTRRIGDTFEIDFMPSPAGGPAAMWFYFRVDPECGSSMSHVRCRLHLPDLLLGAKCSPAGFMPVCRTAQRDWMRVDRVERHARADGRPVWDWMVPGDEGYVEVALCYPYGVAELDGLITDARLTVDVIGLSENHRLLRRVGNGPGIAGSSRPGIYCLARQHAGEMPGSWVLDGLLREMAAAGESAPLVWAVPMADVDGVATGYYGKDRFPWDYNRAWGSKGFPPATHAVNGTHPMRYETHCIQKDMLQWRERCRPVLVLDFHAPSICEAQGIYAFLRDVDSQGRPDARHAVWTDAFAAALGRPPAAEKFVRAGRYASRWNTARLGDYANMVLDLPCLSFETPYACAGDTVFTRTLYRECGRKLAGAVIKQVKTA